MLQGIHPLLTGTLLERLDSMGHSDSIAVVDAHFPARRLGAHVIDLPGTFSPDVIAAIRTVLPLDEPHAIDLMSPLEDPTREVQNDIVAAAAAASSSVGFLERYAFYAASANSIAIVRTGEIRSYGNALLYKGLVTG